MKHLLFLHIANEGYASFSRKCRRLNPTSFSTSQITSLTCKTLINDNVNDWPESTGLRSWLKRSPFRVASPETRMHSSTRIAMNFSQSE